MADEKPEAPKAPEKKPQINAGKPVLFVLLAVVNMLIILGIGSMVFLNKKKHIDKETEQTIEKEKTPESAENTEGAENNEEKENPFLSKLVPLETFLVNLAGTRDKLAKVNIELSVSNGEVQTEIEQVKPKIRDTILIILSTKSYTQVSSVTGKDELREEIKSQLNLLLRKGQVEKVFFTEFLYN